MNDDKIDGWGWGWLFIDEIAKQTGIRVTQNPTRSIRYICGGGDKIEEIRNYFEGAKIKIIHWGGTDVKNAIENGYNGEMKTYKEAIHLADGFNLIPELASIGIKAKMVTWTPKHYFGYVPPLGDRVCVYMPPARREFFRYDLMKEVEKEYGKPFLWLDKPAEELTFVDVKDIIRQSKVLIRAPIHDGLSHTAMEFLTAGRTVLNTQDLPYCVKIEPHLIDILSKINTPPIPEASYFWEDFIDTHHIRKLFATL